MRTQNFIRSAALLLVVCALAIANGCVTLATDGSLGVGADAGPPPSDAASSEAAASGREGDGSLSERDGATLPTDASYEDAPQKDCCIGHRIEWGRVAFQNPRVPAALPPTTHELDGCGAYGRLWRGKDVVCRAELPSCNAEDLAVDANDILAVLEDAEVQEALALASVNSTLDPEGPYPLYFVRIDGVESILAFFCDAASACSIVPAGAQRLFDALQAVAMQQRVDGECAFPAECMEPPQRGPCSDSIIRYAYYPTSADCRTLVWGGCEANGNNFLDSGFCRAACMDDPCAEGVTFATETECEDLHHTVGVNWCFNTDSQACACACQRSGGSLDTCAVELSPVRRVTCTSGDATALDAGPPPAP